MFSVRALYFVFFFLALFIDYLLKSNFLGEKIRLRYLQFVRQNYFYISSSIFLFLLIIFSTLSYFDISLFINNEPYFNFDFKSNMSANPTEGVNTTITPSEGINNVAAAASSAGGATVALKVAQAIPGSPATKLAAAAGTMALVQAGTLVMSKALNNQNSNNNDNTNQLATRLLSDSTGDSLENKFTDYPLNLLVEVNQLINVEILFLTVMFNIFIVHKLLSIDYVRYIPNNKFGNILKIIISRYINIWSKASMFILVLSWIMLFSSVFLIKFCLLQIG